MWQDLHGAFKTPRIVTLKSTTVAALGRLPAARTRLRPCCKKGAASTIMCFELEKAAEFDRPPRTRVATIPLRNKGN
jgi:hypothetical protein